MVAVFGNDYGPARVSCGLRLDGPESCGFGYGPGSHRVRHSRFVEEVSHAQPERRQHIHIGTASQAPNPDPARLGVDRQTRHPVVVDRALRQQVAPAINGPATCLFQASLNPLIRTAGPSQLRRRPSILMLELNTLQVVRDAGRYLAKGGPLASHEAFLT